MYELVISLFYILATLFPLSVSLYMSLQTSVMRTAIIRLLN